MTGDFDFLIIAAVNTLPPASPLAVIIASSLGLRCRRYKRSDAESAEPSRYYPGLHRCVEMPDKLMSLANNPHVLDVVVCVPAGADFVAGQAVGPGPDDLKLAKRKGWIWVRRTDR